MTLVARAPRPTDGWAVTTGPCGRPVGASLSSGSGETPRQCGPDSGHDTRRHRAVGIANPCLAERGINMRNQTLCVRTFHLSDSQLSASTTRDPRYVLCTGKELVPRGEQWSVPPWGQGTRHRTRAHDSQDPGRCQVPAEQLLCCRVYRVLALSPIL